MDTFTAIVGALQINNQCGHCTIALARYINHGATVDAAVSTFYEDVSKLQTSYQALEKSFKSPQVVAGAKLADRVTDGIWTYLATMLRDCENTIMTINHILSKINRPLGLGAHFRQMIEPPLKQLQEQMHTGELGRYHERLKVFSISMELPTHIIHIALQTNHRELNDEHQRKLSDRMQSMQRLIDTLHTSLGEMRHPKRPIRRSSTSSSRILVGIEDVEKAVCKHMEAFISKAAEFLSSVSNMTGIQVSASTPRAENRPSFRASLDLGGSLTHRPRTQTTEWSPRLPQDSTTAPSESASGPPSPPEFYEPDDDDGYASDGADFELDLVRTYFENGQGDCEQKEFGSAEENFTEALKLLQKNDFGERLAFQSADVILLLAHCYLEQSKFDQAIDLLLPLTGEDSSNGQSESSASQTSSSPPLHQMKAPPDEGRILAAHHALGVIYVRKRDYENAEKHSLYAFKGRWRHFDKRHDKTLESAKLVVDMYLAKGERAKARAYSKYLNPETERRRPSKPSGESVPSVTTSQQVTSQQAPSQQATTTVSRQTSPRQASFSRDPMRSLERLPSPGATSAPQLPPISPSVGRKLSNDLHLHPADNMPTSPLQSPPPLPIFDDASTVSSVTQSSPRRSASVVPKQLLKPRFDDIKKEAALSKEKACEAAHHLLRSYDPDPSKILLHRWDDIKRNIRRQGAEKGLAATGAGYAPIHFFCELKEEHVTEVELLMEAGADLTAVKYKPGYGTQDPMTPLQIAVDRGHRIISAIMIEYMQELKYPAERVNALRDKDDFSPLLVACRRGHIDTVSRLLDFGANVSNGFPRLWCGNSLLHDACWRCDATMVRFLLSCQSHIDDRKYWRHDLGAVGQQDQFGRTPLMYAVISKNIADQAKRDRKVRGRYQCVELLLAYGGDNLFRDLSLKDNKWQDVFGYAADEGDKALIDMLQNAALRSKAVEMG